MVLIRSISIEQGTGETAPDLKFFYGERSSFAFWLISFRITIWLLFWGIQIWPDWKGTPGNICLPDSSPHNCTRKNSENPMFVNYWRTLVQKSWDCKLELYQWSVLDWKGRCDCGCDIDTVTLSWKSLDGERWEAGMVALLSMHLIKGPSASAGTCNCWISFSPFTLELVHLGPRS